MSSPTAELYKQKQKLYQKAGQADANPAPVAPVVAPVNRVANSNSSDVATDDDKYTMFTRAQLNDLYTNENKSEKGFSLNNGAIEHIMMMFQLCIALIVSLSQLGKNAASMSASFLFGNETLINMFSIFLENALNLILNRKVADMSLDELQQSLQQNKPKLQQMSALLISAISTLALGLSDVCSRIAADWVENVLPGLLKSSATTAANAAKAGINVVTVGASDEILDILSAATNIVGGMTKVIMGLSSNVENFSEAFRTVKTAYEELKDLKELFSKSPSEIATAATAAVLPESLKNVANNIVTKGIDGLTNTANPFLTSAAASLLPAGINPSSATFNDLVDIGVNKGVDAGVRAVKTIGNTIKEAVTPASAPASALVPVRNRAGVGGGFTRNKNKSMKYKNKNKNKKHFKRYMSNLRRKTAKKELDLLNGIRDFKSMIS
jgi:hypothetical protein